MKSLALSCLFIRQSHAFTHQAHLSSPRIIKLDGYHTKTRHLNPHVNSVLSRTPSISCIHHKSIARLYPNDETSSSLEMVPTYDGAAYLQTNTTAIDQEVYSKEKRKTMKKRRNRIKVSMALSSIITALFVLIYISGPGQWRYYLAGGICAAVSHAITTPVDVIKTRKQLDESMKDMGLIQSGVKIIKEDKLGAIHALFAGLGPTTIGYLFEGAVKFGVYEVLKPMVRSFLIWSSSVSKIAWLNSNLLGFVISGSVAGAAASIMLCPMEALRIRLVADPEFASKGNWVDCGIKMINNEGIKGLWKSLPSMLYKQVPYTVTKNVSFDVITRASYKAIAGCGRDICGRTKILIPLVSAMIASVLSCISSQPGDMLLSVINAEKGKVTTREHMRNIMKDNGIGGFFIGMQERFVHVGMIVTVQLLIYDFVKRLVGIQATGL